ncbi:BTB/POZ domain-containing protein At5g03250-like [Vigna radiata var. radiata]|uniref:BTB/POZ domain-containing protein At5g03250-like n=1 Tax=Vigna radiata var. radiata TaxID=3916 RepID=A0A1S3TH49_VIGRR|nr:BTB/POZ domain-containing protein At5g03250-like [Vigna radiata var. radiata]
MELTASNVVGLRCAAEYLQMSENYGEGNLIMQTEKFLNHVFGYWTDSIVALKTCEEVLPMAEELHIASRCINSLVLKVADQSLVNLPVSSGPRVAQSLEDAEVWNGISLNQRFIRSASATVKTPSSVSVPEEASRLTVDDGDDDGKSRNSMSRSSNRIANRFGEGFGEERDEKP